MARGRPVGSVNKPNKRLLSARLEALYGEEFNPVLKMAENAVVLQQMAENSITAMTDGIESHEDADEIKKLKSSAKSDIQSVNDTWDKIAQYVQPKLKQVEHSGDINAGIEMHHTVEVVRVSGNDTDS